MFHTRRSRPSALLVVGMVSMVASFFVLSSPAGAHQGLISGETQVICDQDAVALSWVAVSWDMVKPNGRHPSITIDMRSEVTDWVVIGHGAFTDENGRSLSGTAVVPAGATMVEVRVTPDPEFTWETVDVVGGTDSATLAVSSAPSGCGAVSPGEEEATPTPTAEPTVEPTATPTATPEPTAVPTELPTPTPTVEPTPTATEEVEVLPPPPEPTPTATATATPTPEVRAEVEDREDLARTGAESGFIVLVGLTLLVGGALFTVTGVSAARREN